MKIVTVFMHWLMLSCKRATQLIEKKMHFGLNPLEKFQLHLHKQACKYCAAFEKQNEVIDQILQNGMDEHLNHHNLAEKEKEGMKAAVREKMEGLET